MSTIRISKKRIIKSNGRKAWVVRLPDGHVYTDENITKKKHLRIAALHDWKVVEVDSEDI